jgi:PilZ domain
MIEFHIAVCVRGCYFQRGSAKQGARMGDLSDRREARRFVMTLPVRVLGHGASSPELRANTRDVSYRGLYFLTEARFEDGSEIDFILTLPQQMISAGDVNIRCHGKVVRIEPTDNGKMGIAAKIERYEFVPVRAPAA